MQFLPHLPVTVLALFAALSVQADAAPLQSSVAARVILHESQKPVPSHGTLQIPPSSSYNPCSLDPAVLCRLGVGSRAAALPEGRIGSL